MNEDHIQEKMSNQDILIFPFIFMYILVYIRAIHPYSYLSKLSNVYPVYPLLSKFNIQGKYPKWYPTMISWLYPNVSICIQYRYLYQISCLIILKCPFYPCPISRENIHDDIQLWYPSYIQVYPCLSNIDIRIRYPWCYPIMLSCYIRLYPWYLSFCPYMARLCLGFFCSALLFWLQRLANILKYPFISFQHTLGPKVLKFFRPIYITKFLDSNWNSRRFSQLWFTSQQVTR